MRCPSSLLWTTTTNSLGDITRVALRNVPNNAVYFGVPPNLVPGDNSQTVGLYILGPRIPIIITADISKEARARKTPIMSINTVGANPSYDHLRRKNSSKSFLARNDSYRRSTRGSDGTVNTTSSARTNITAPPEFSKKFVVVGDGGCGKTCLLISYSQGYFPEKYVPTVFENYITTVEHKPSGKGVELALWDTAGQEEYDRLRPLSYPETDLLFVCFAIDCPNSLENVLDKWYPEVLHFCPTTPIILCGLKSDLRHKRTCIELLKTQGLTPVTKEQGKTVAQKMGALYMECSSKEATGVQDIFDTAIDIAVRGQDELIEQDTRLGSRGSQTLAPKKKKRSKCQIL